MKVSISLLSLGIASMIIPSLLIAAEKDSDLFDTIYARKQLWAKFYNADDAASLTAMYTEDATVIAPNFPPDKGHAAIQAGLEAELALGDGTIQLKTLEVHRINKKTAWELGSYDLKIVLEEGEPIVDVGHYVIIWKLIDDEWLLHMDTWNTSLPLE
ncbi:MAG: DUF4440 domain-containing protein [Puniceicoccaceae bacterium]